MASHIYTIPVGAPFLDTLASAILSGRLPQEGMPKPGLLKLSDITILLPTQRATRAAQQSFLTASGKRALIMPQLIPISVGNEDGSLLSSLTAGATSPDELDLPPAVSSMSRTLTLMQLVQRWSEHTAAGSQEAKAVTPAQAANMASELASLMDAIERENVSLDSLHTLVPDSFAVHWQHTVDFLNIITDVYPTLLQADGKISPAERTNRLIMNEAERLAKMASSDHPVIVTGVTGSIPATVELMRAVMQLPNGAIVLPGLDQSLDEESWQNVLEHPEHPQYGFRKLLDSLGHDRSDVQVLATSQLKPELGDRNRLMSEALRPSDSTARWQDFTRSADKQALRKALDGIELIEAPSALDESEIIALILREAIEEPGRTAALVSPDRVLARRVAIRLESWGIRVDDSAGRPFMKTVPGTFLSLIIEAASRGFQPADTIALLKHPLCRMQMKAFDVRRFCRALELIAFRTPYLGRGIIGIEAAISRFQANRLDRRPMQKAVARLWDEDIAGAEELTQRMKSAFASLTELLNQTDSLPLARLAAAHLQVAETLAETGEEETEEGSTSSLYTGVAGETAHALFQEMMSADMPVVEIEPAAYRDLYASLIARENVRERTPVHPRLSIWGPYEARLQQPDIVILGSLNEGTWPEAADPGAWLNRPMRTTIGLPQPEVEIGRAALDFANQLGGNRIYLTRATKINGIPTVPSRWLMRFEALLQGLELRDAVRPAQPWLQWARARDAISVEKQRIEAPEPRPALDLRPRKLSVTAIETWLRNPYAIYARHILGLDVLPKIGTPPDQSLRGALVHEVLSEFANTYPEQLPDNIYDSIIDIAHRILGRYTGHPRVAALWLPRLTRFLKWFAETERNRREQVKTVYAEISGAHVIDAPNGPFTLTARADRIDATDAGLIITDYKTGQLPTQKSVANGFAPQLPLEAAIAASETGFPGLAGQPTLALKYIRASGGQEPGKELTLKLDNIAEIAQQCIDGLTALIARFDDETTPYAALRRPVFRYDYDDYAHLARVAEWSAHVDTDEPAR